MSGIDVLSERREEVEQPQAFLFVQQTRILFETTDGVYAELLADFLYLGYVVRMLGGVLTVAIGPKGVYAAQRVLEQYPLLLFRVHVLSIVALYVCQPLSSLVLYPDIIPLRQGRHPSGNNGVLYGNCYSLISRDGAERDGLLVVNVDVCQTFHVDGLLGIVGKELWRVIGDTLHVGLPGQEVLTQEVAGHVGQLPHTATQNLEDSVDVVAAVCKYRCEGLAEFCLHIRGADVGDLHGQVTLYGIAQVYLYATVCIRGTGPR